MLRWHVDTHITIELLSSGFNFLDRRHGHEPKSSAPPSVLIINYLPMPKASIRNLRHINTNKYQHKTQVT